MGFERINDRLGHFHNRVVVLDGLDAAPRSTIPICPPDSLTSQRRADLVIYDPSWKGQVEEVSIVRNERIDLGYRWVS